MSSASKSFVLAILPVLLVDVVSAPLQVLHQDPQCDPAAQFAVNEMKKKGMQILSFLLQTCTLNRKQFFSLSMDVYLKTQRKHCKGIIVWVRPFKEVMYSITNPGKCNNV